MRQSHELRLLLGDPLSNQPLEVLEGKKVIEVRLRGVSKGVVAQRVDAETGSGTIIVAIGDDRTDEELFRALPSCSLTVAVGRPWTAAAFRLEDHRPVRRILRLLVPDQSVVDGRSVATDDSSRRLARRRAGPVTRPTRKPSDATHPIAVRKTG